MLKDCTHTGGSTLRLWRLLPILALLVLFPFLVQAQEPIRTEEAIVKKVVDGDTVRIITLGDAELRVRLYGIDAPEKAKIDRRTGIVSKPGQPHGGEAYTALESKVLGKEVKVQIMDIDRYRRTVSILYLNHRDINREMVREGYAWAYREYLQGPPMRPSISMQNVKPGVSTWGSGSRRTLNRRGNSEED